MFHLLFIYVAVFYALAVILALIVTLIAALLTFLIVSTLFFYLYDKGGWKWTLILVPATPLIAWLSWHFVLFVFLFLSNPPGWFVTLVSPLVWLWHVVEPSLSWFAGVTWRFFHILPTLNDLIYMGHYVLYGH